MILYVTYNDLPSGIYSSQVTDVVKFISLEFNEPVKLLAFISLRNYRNNKNKIISELPGSIVIPMFPGVQRWKYNQLSLNLICRIKKVTTIIGRSVLATNLALKAPVKNVIYDGRGAITAEWNEYKVVTNPLLLETINSLEKNAVLNSNFRISVSQKLIEHWQKEFGYTSSNHVVIPCTLNNVFEKLEISTASNIRVRKSLNINENDTLYIYSGSLAGWQSFTLLYEFIKPVLLQGSQNKILFLSEKDENITRLEKEFKNSVICKKVEVGEVPKYLLAGDYGLIIREQSITNKVASPVKFAEYLSCGLKVLISDYLGDYTEFVIKNKCGFIFSEYKKFVKPTESEKNEIRILALQHFTKKANRPAYKQLIDQIRNKIF